MPLEKKLAQRIHNQRVRLRQLEDFRTQDIEADAFNHSRWLRLACRALRENADLRAKLGIGGRFDQSCR